MTPERIESIYTELGTLVIELDADPASRGAGYLQDIISKTRGMLNRVSFFLREVHKEIHALTIELDATEAAFQVSSDELLTSDKRVKDLPALEDRKAMINIILKDDRLNIQTLSLQIKELGFVENTIKHHHKYLDNTMSAIRLQKSLVDAELRTGSFYGDEAKASRGHVGVSEAMSEDELNRLMAEADLEVSA